MKVKRGLFIAGTDTGVGKTLVAGALAALLRDPVPGTRAEIRCQARVKRHEK